MAKKPLRLLHVGALKTPHWKDAAAHYLQRLQHWRTVQQTIVKDGNSALPPAERNKWEGQKLIEAIKPHEYIICLDERGQSFTSKDFAKFLEKNSENITRPPCFIIGGAFGLDPMVREKSHYLLSLGPMTLPHELARVVLLEQLYRAEAIVRGVPYHH